MSFQDRAGPAAARTRVELGLARRSETIGVCLRPHRGDWVDARNSRRRATGRAVRRVVEEPIPATQTVASRAARLATLRLAGAGACAIGGLLGSVPDVLTVGAALAALDSMLAPLQLVTGHRVLPPSPCEVDPADAARRRRVAGWPRCCRAIAGTSSPVTPTTPQPGSAHTSCTSSLLLFPGTSRKRPSKVGAD
jgi:hypothetical protein